MRKIIKNLIYIVISLFTIRVINSDFWGSNNWGYFISLLVINLIILVLYDWVMMFLLIKIKLKIYKRVIANTESASTINILRWIKIDYILSLISYYGRLNLVSSTFREKNEIYSYIRFSKFKYKIKYVIKLCFSLPVLINSIYVFWLKDKIFDFSFLKKLIEDIFLEYKIENIWQHIEKIPIIVAILPILLVFYFTGNKHLIKSIVSKKETENKKLVINKILDLLLYFEECLYDISKNMDVLLKSQDKIVTECLKNEIENAHEFLEKKPYISCSLDSSFNEIKTEKQIKERINELFCMENIAYFEELFFYNFKLRSVYFYLYQEYAYFLVNNSKQTSLDLLLNPYKYINEKIQILKKKNNKGKISKSDYEALFRNKKKSLIEDIYNSLRLLYSISLFVDEFNYFKKNSSMDVLIEEIVKNK